MGSIKDRNGMDLTEAEDIKKRWQEYTEELYRKDFHDPDNHDDVITHLEPDIWNMSIYNISLCLSLSIYIYRERERERDLVTQSCPTL